MKKKSLYEISHEIESFVEKIIENGGELSEDQEKDLIELDSFLSTKLDQCVYVIQKQEDFIKCAKERITELTDAKRVREKAISTIKTAMVEAMQKTGKTKHVGELMAIKLRKPSKKVEIYDQELLPIEYISIKKEIVIDKRSLLADLKEGRLVEGAKVIDGEQGLTIGLKSNKD